MATRRFAQRPEADAALAQSTKPLEKLVFVIQYTFIGRDPSRPTAKYENFASIRG